MEEMKSEGGSVFTQDSAIKKTKPYTFKELVKARLGYFIICGVLLITGLALILSDFLISNKSKDYGDYLNIKNVNDQLDRDSDEYYIFYYQKGDKKCNELKPTLFNYAEEQALSTYKSKPLYFVNVSSVFKNYDTETESYDSYVGLEDSSKLIIKTPMVLVSVKSKAVESVLVDFNTIKEELTAKSYDDYKENQITKASDQLNRNEEVYYIYYYQKSCSACQSISNLIRFYIESNQIKLYLVNINVVNEVVGTKPESYEGITDYKLIKIDATPTLLKIENNTVKSSYIGSNAISGELSK